MSDWLLEALATTEPMAQAFSDAAVLGSMLRFETALARVEARAGIIPDLAAAAISRVPLDAFDPAAIARDARASGTIAIPFVEALTSRVRDDTPEAAAFVHWGTTSQDLSDTALILCLKRAHGLLAGDHARLASALRRLSNEHAGTIMLARTLLQPAAPTTFGLKAAGWLGAATRCETAMTAAFREACVLQFGGAAGTLAALGADGLMVAAGVARDLDLRLPDAPWHAHRDRLAALVAACGVYAGTLGKIARDVSLLMQFEVGEAAEPGGGSSSMPHKRNPARCALIPPPRPGCRAWSPRFSPGPSRNTSADSAAGTRRPRPSPRWFKRRPPPSPPPRSSPNRCGSIPSACSGTSTRPAAWSSPSAR